MATHRSWIFETDAPLDAFRYWFLRVLRSRDWRVEDADVYDREVHGPDGRAYLRLAYHEDGVRLDAKLRTGFLTGSADGMAEDLTAAGRRAQELARREEPASPAEDEPNG